MKRFRRWSHCMLLKKVLREMLFLCFLFVFTSFAGNSFAANFENSRLVEVGPVSLLIDDNPIRFSPSGDKLGYFSGRTFITFDSNSTTREVITLEMNPISWDWLSNEEILLFEFRSLGRLSDIHRISQIDVSTGTIANLHEHERGSSGFKPTTEPIRGLYRTLEENLSYRIGTKATPSSKFPESKHNRISQSSALSEDHFLDWGWDGLYRISANLIDSVRIGPLFGRHQSFRPVYSSDLRYVISCEVVYNTIDSTFLDFRDFLQTPESFSNCIIYSASFNPASPEILFNWSCHREDDGRDVESDFIGLFDIITGTVIPLDLLLGMENFRAPIFSKDGNKIAFVSDGIVYILHRGESE